MLQKFKESGDYKMNNFDSSNIALEVFFEALTKFKIYRNQAKVYPPRGKGGKHEALFILGPTMEAVENVLQDTYMDYKTFRYRKYYIDQIYREKIGTSRIVQTHTSDYARRFKELNLQGNVLFVKHQSKKSILKDSPNVLVNLGKWMELYNTHKLKKSKTIVTKNYINFLVSKIDIDIFSSYNKTLYIDIDSWYSRNEFTIGFSAPLLNNPLSVFLYAAYALENEIEEFHKLNINIFLVDKIGRSTFLFNSSDLTKKNYSILKSRILSLKGVKIDLSSIENPETDEPEVLDEKQKLTKQLVRSMTSNLLGETEDITTSLDEDEDEEEYDKYDITDDIEEEDDETGNNTAEIKELEASATKYIKQHPELLEKDYEVAVAELEENVASTTPKSTTPKSSAEKTKGEVSAYNALFNKERTKEQIKRIEELEIKQESIIGPSLKNDKKSLSIVTEHLDTYIRTGNYDIVKSKFINFDKSYNAKKLENDLDYSIATLNNGDTKVFITEKKKIDTSTPLTQKHTYVYSLQDENGKRMSVRFDVPRIIDDNYVFVNGSRKIIQHQLVLKPIVKTKEDTVQIVTAYSKIFITRHGKFDVKTSSITNYLNQNAETYNVVLGNAYIKNKGYNTTLDFDLVGKRLYSFDIGKKHFNLDLDKLYAEMDKKHVDYSEINQDKFIIVGYDTKTREPLYVERTGDAFSNYIVSLLPEDYRITIGKFAKGNKNRLIYNRCKIMKENIPVALLCFYCEGFDTVMKKANIEYDFITEEELDDLDLGEWGITPLSDGYIKWKRYPIENSLLMNGFNRINTELYSMTELESKDTYIYMLAEFYKYTSMVLNLDQFRDFMLDDISKEILASHKLPIDFVGVLVYASSLLRSNDFKLESHEDNLRVRSNELISTIMYKAVSKGYEKYRKTQHKPNPTPITVKGNEIFTQLSDSGLLEEDSTLNPILQLSKREKVTLKGPGGIGLDDAMTLDKRAYHLSMLGNVGMTTSPDAGVGVNRNLTFEPRIYNTRGELETVKSIEDVEKLSSTNLLTSAELLTPMGAEHDDPPRTSMAYKQTMYMLMPEDSEPVMIGNGIEKVIPYRMSSTFTIVAEDDGVVIDAQGDDLIIKYNNGKYRNINTGLQNKKNAAAGFLIPTKLTCHKKVGDKVKKGEVVAWNELAFTKNSDDLGASMNLGARLKVAVIPEWDIYEDSGPASNRASEKLSVNMSEEVRCTLNKSTYVYDMVKVGDKVSTGDALIRFDQTHDDPSTQAYFDQLRKTLSEEELASFVDSNVTTKKSEYTGTITDIKITCTVELEELSPSLRKIVSEYYKKLEKRNKFLAKYSNDGDNNYYRAGDIIYETAEKVNPDLQGKIKGSYVGEGVLIEFFVTYKDKLAKGDKFTSEFALKGINSHVIEPGYEPYSETAPDEPIDLIIAPLSLSARKVTAIFKAMFGNKVLIRAKDDLQKYWNEN